MDGITGEIERIAKSVLSEEQQSRVVMRPTMTNFELTYRLDNGETVGLVIPMSMFHQTEDFDQKWKNIFYNLIDAANNTELNYEGPDDENVA